MAILEVGCGSYPDPRATLKIDISRQSEADIVCDAHQLPFKGQIFDEIICFETLEHLKSPYKAISEYNRVLKPSGLLHVSIPNLMYWRCILRWTLKGKIAVHNEHIYGWRLSELQNLLCANGFTIEEVEFKDTHHHHPSLFKSILPRITKHSMIIIARRNVNENRN